MEYTIEGKLAQSVRLKLKEGEKCWASRGSLMALDQGVRWTLKVPGGISGAGRRMLSGEGISLILVEGAAGGGEVILSSHQPGKVTAWNLDESPALATRGLGRDLFHRRFGQIGVGEPPIASTIFMHISLCITRIFNPARSAGVRISLSRV